MKELLQTARFVQMIQEERRRELPCKDLDMDCLSDQNGNVPFGSYVRCYLYDPDKGSCPFLPL